MADQERDYEPVDTISETVKTAAITGAAGFGLSAVKNALARQNYGMLGVFTRTGNIITVWAITGAGYQFSKNAAANLRRKNDSYNEAIGGFVGGSIAGLAKSRSAAGVIGYGAALSVLMSAFDYTGARLKGYTQNSNEDPYEKKIALRENRRRPIQETIDQLGEGRGIHGPGYLERRRERIRQNHGIDVGPRGRGPEQEEEA